MPDARVIPLHSPRGEDPQHRSVRSTASAARPDRDDAENRRSTPQVTTENDRGALLNDPTQNDAAQEDLTREDPTRDHAVPKDRAQHALPESDESGSDWERAVTGAVAFVRQRLVGEYPVDEFGFDEQWTESVLLPALRPLYEKWFRVEAIGLHNVPDTGALVVANHSGTLPWDALMTAVALRDHHPTGRHLRMLAADLVFRLPAVGTLARKAGHTLACGPDADRLLAAGELVGVWPEGFKGIGKPFRDRYKLQRFGRGGFVSAAVRAGVPIVPCSIVGAEEIYPKIAEITPLARLFGLPYFPVTPLFPHFGPLGTVPLPSKWYIEFGEPLDTTSYEADAADDPTLVFGLSDQVRETIQQTLYRLVAQRRNVFLG